MSITPRDAESRATALRANIQIGARWWADHLDREPDEKERFFHSLIRCLLELCSGLFDGKILLETDYDPDDLMRKALKQAQIELPEIATGDGCRRLGLPTETVMLIGPDGFELWHGGEPKK